MLMIKQMLCSLRPSPSPQKKFMLKLANILHVVPLSWPVIWVHASPKIRTTQYSGPLVSAGGQFLTVCGYQILWIMELWQEARKKQKSLAEVSCRPYGAWGHLQSPPRWDWKALLVMFRRAPKLYSCGLGTHIDLAIFWCARLYMVPPYLWTWLRGSQAHGCMASEHSQTCLEVPSSLISSRSSQC